MFTKNGTVKSFSFSLPLIFLFHIVLIHPFCNNNIHEMSKTKTRFYDFLCDSWKLKMFAEPL